MLALSVKWNWWDKTSQEIFLKGSYDAILKIIILCVWCNRICWHALMLKHFFFKHCTLLYVLYASPLSNMAVFYKAPPSDKCSLLWLANRPSALWLAEHHKPRLRCNTPFHNRELQTLVFATLRISSMHEQLVTLQRERNLEIASYDPFNIVVRAA